MKARFYLLRPYRLPSVRCAFVADAEVGAVLCAKQPLPVLGPEDVALAAVTRALQRLALEPEKFAVVDIDPDESSGNRDNDRAFGIVRVEGPVMPLLLHSTLCGLKALLEEALTGGTDISPQEWGRLRHAFAAIFDALAGRAPEPRQAPPMSPSAGERERDALRRWIRGHHIFMVLIQGLIVGINCFRRDIEGHDYALARSALGLATAILWGAQAALRFTGDYSHSAYEKAVRPTLMPPVAPPGMSGLRWRDHEYFVKQLAGLRQTFATLHPSLASAHQAFHEALANVYESHKFVCARFVGTERASLLSVSLPVSSTVKRSAVASIDHLKHIRLHLIKEKTDS